MTNSVCLNAQNVLVRFHIGRGERFHSPGHKTYVTTVDSLADCFGDADVVSTDCEGKTLPDKDWQLIDSGGNVILEGREKIEAADGVLDWDGDYDTDIVRYISECSNEEYQLIIDAYNDYEYVDGDVLDYACMATGMYRAKSPSPFVEPIQVEDDKMIIHTQDGDRVIERNECSNEDEARCVVCAMDFIKISVNEIVWTMENEDWFDEEKM